MKKIIFTLLFAIIAISSLHAQKQIKVTLKNGTTMTGVAKSIDPTSSIVLTIAGIDSTIPFDKVANVEELKAENNNPSDVVSEDVPTKDNPLIVTDNAEYPSTIDIDIAGDKYTFVLVRGGDYLMGYDGHGSLGYHSEPVHRVKVTSFYICNDNLKIKTVKKLYNNNNGGEKGSHKTRTYRKLYDIGVNSRGEDSYKTRTYSSELEIVNLASISSGLQLRLPLEAEWEYAARGRWHKDIFKTQGTVDVCQDLYAPYVSREVLTDPVVEKGEDHVLRVFNNSAELFNRPDKKGHLFQCIRLAIKAKDALAEKH